MIKVAILAAIQVFCADKLGLYVLMFRKVVMLAALSAVPLTKSVNEFGSGNTADVVIHACSYQPDFFVWFGVEMAFLGVVVAWGLALAIKSRNLPSAFN